METKDEIDFEDFGYTNMINEKSYISNISNIEDPLNSSMR